MARPPPTPHPTITTSPKARIPPRPQAGDYHLYGPDLGQNLLIAGDAGITPRWLPFLEMITLPVIGLVEMIVCWWFDRFAHKYARRREAQQADAKKRG